MYASHQSVIGSCLKSDSLLSNALDSVYNMTEINVEVRDEQLTKLARNYLSIDTLVPRNSDSLDFHDVAVWGIRQAMELAYEAGRMSK